MSTHAVRYVAHSVERRVPPGHVSLVRVELENTGSLTWEAVSPRGDHVGIAVSWDGVVVANHPLPRTRVGPNEPAALRFALEAPLTSGVHRLRIELVQYQVALFSERGSPPLEFDVVVTDAPVDACAAHWASAQAHDPWHYLPTRGIARASDGTSWPVFVERAQGCHLWDQAGRRYVDYTMGWGTVLLGYADPRISAAIATAARSGSVVAWPQTVEIDVARMLAEDFASARVPRPMVCFGKNGSDACTFAVRMARVATGRRTVLFCGYHGWQDFWVEQVGFDRTGVPARDPALIHRYGFHDRASFAALYERHRSDLAAVMLEPSPWAGDGLGFEGDTERAFVHELADAARAAGAVFILDEILTGYRHPAGSVQRATGVAPDLTCVGKAIASGMPLSAVVGSPELFKAALPRTFYAATFHSEAYSLAAARAAVAIYRAEPVARHVWDYGIALRDGIERLRDELGVQARVRGTAYRMNFQFEDPNLDQRQLERTLFQQELLRAGVTTYNGVMLPCGAHDEAALGLTLDAYGRALEIVATARRRGDWERRLEIPPLIDL